MIDTIKNIISNVSDYINEITKFITGLSNLFITFCNFIPSPFKGILLSVLAILIIILILRSVGK